MILVTEEAVGAGALCHVPHVAGGQQLYAVAGTDIVRFCSHKGVNNQREIDKGEKDNIEIIIAGKNVAKAFDTPKQSLDLISLFVQLLIIAPGIFSVPFR